MWHFFIVSLCAYKNKNKIIFNTSFDIHNPHIGRDNKYQQNCDDIIKDITRIRNLYKKKQLLDILEDDNISIYNKLKLLNIPNNDITAENIALGLKMDDFIDLL
jgi:hypothetical protein